MNKFLFPIFLLMGLWSCYPTIRLIKSPKHLFEDLNANYPLNEQPLKLFTSDRTYILNSARLIDSGKIEADIVSSYDKKNFISIYTQLPSDLVITKLTDSAGKETDIIQFSETNVTKILRIKKKRGHDKELIYDQDFKNKSLLQVIIIISALGLIYLIFLGISEELSKGDQCFIATMVYGSVDTWEVVILRRYRDETLATYFLGRVFIKCYHTFSPTFVKLFRNNEPVKQFIKVWLDKWVCKLAIKYNGKIIKTQEATL